MLYEQGDGRLSRCYVDLARGGRDVPQHLLAPRLFTSLAGVFIIQQMTFIHSNYISVVRVVVSGCTHHLIGCWCAVGNHFKGQII